MKTLRGQRLTEQDYADVARQLRELLYDLLFRPIVELLAPRNEQVRRAVGDLRNAKSDPVVAAINSGRIQYVDGIFSGDFDARISSVLRSYGARFNKVTRTFAALPEQLPAEVVEVAEEKAQADKKLHDRLMDRLNGIQHSFEALVDARPVDARKTIAMMDRKFDRSYGDALGTEGLSKEAKARLDRRYADSLKPYIKKFTGEMIHELRGIVKANAEQGYRFDSLVKRLENRFDVSKSKAEFLARNETSIFTARHRQARFGDAGVTSYVWRTAGDAEVRKDHAHLNGRSFEYAKPPVVDEATGRRANPGEDYNCLPGDSPIDFAYGIRKGLARPYSGELVTLITESGKTIRCTPNHQVLTLTGWKEAGLLNNTDYVINLSGELKKAKEVDNYNGVPPISQVVQSIKHASSFGKAFRVLPAINLNADMANRYVHTVHPAWCLMLWVKARCFQGLEQLVLALSDFSSTCLGTGNGMPLLLGIAAGPQGNVCVPGQTFPILERHVPHALDHAFVLVSDVHVKAQEFPVQGGPRHPNSIGQGQEAFSSLVSLGEWLNLKMNLVQRAGYAPVTQSLKQWIARTAESLNDGPSRDLTGYHADRLVDIRTAWFSGHVYNLETENNWFCTNGIIIHNCRCSDEPIISEVLTNA